MLETGAPAQVSPDEFLLQTQAGVSPSAGPPSAYCVNPVFFINRSTEDHKEGRDRREEKEGLGGSGDDGVEGAGAEGRRGV